MISGCPEQTTEKKGLRLQIIYDSIKSGDDRPGEIVIRFVERVHEKFLNFWDVFIMKTIKFWDIFQK